MANQLDFQPLKEKLEEANSFLILIDNQPNKDKVAAGLALYLSLKEGAKNVTINCSQPMTVAFNRLIGINKITDKIGNRNLVISFDYVKDAIEKVSYHIKDNKFNLVVKPKAGHPPLDTSRVSYSHLGTEADLIFTLGASQLNDLGKIYQQAEEVFQKTTVVNIDNQKDNHLFGQINLNNPQSISLTEVVASLIKELNLPINQDIASNLYAGIKAGSANFQAKRVNALTFETAAWCLKNGARKEMAEEAKTSPQKLINPVLKENSIFSKKPEFKTASRPKQPPPDWFKPKIYKSGVEV